MLELPEIAVSAHIAEVIVWQNDMVMVFDDKGNQMPDYQGPYKQVQRKIRNVYNGLLTFGNWHTKKLSNDPRDVDDWYGRLIARNQP